MVARRFSVRLKPNSVAEFTEKEEKEVIPVMRKVKGFRDMMAFVSSSGKEAFVITLWDSPESAEAYGCDAYPALVKVLANVIEGPPLLETFIISNSTSHKIAGAAA